MSPLPYTDEAAIIAGICACITAEHTATRATIDTAKTDIIAAIQALRADNTAENSILNASIVAFKAEQDININAFKTENDVNLTENTVAIQTFETNLVTYLSSILGESADFFGTHSAESIWKMIAHLHNRHFHWEDDLHQAQDWSLIPTGNFFGVDNPIGGFWGGFEVRAGVLASEFFGSQDFDGGGGGGNSIYGQVDGFQIDETDTDFPPLLYGVHSHPNFGFPPITITWAQYLTSIGF